MRNSSAYRFSSGKSLYEMETILNQSGVWTWRVRDCAWYADFLQSNPQAGVRVCIFEEKPPGGPVYKTHTEHNSTVPLSEIDAALLRQLEALGAADLTQLDAPGEWPFD